MNMQTNINHATLKDHAFGTYGKISKKLIYLSS